MNKKEIEKEYKRTIEEQDLLIRQLKRDYKKIDEELKQERQKNLNIIGTNGRRTGIGLRYKQ